MPLKADDAIYGPLNRQDTLWNIAEKLRPSKNVTTQQVMMALYQKNPHAFTVNNISSLRKGAHLLAATEAEVKQIKRKTAITMVQRHNRRWKKRRFVRTNAPIPAELKQRLAAQNAPANTNTPEQTAQNAEATAATDSTATTAVTVTATQQTDTATGAIPAPQKIAATNPGSSSNAPLEAQLRQVQAELAQTKAENQRLNSEMLQLKQSQQTTQQAVIDQKIQTQLDVLKHELAELRTILTEKNNHIKQLQASLKEASHAIKSQHADNMRLYNKLKELSPESVVANVNGKQNAPAKPQLELAEVNSRPLTVSALNPESEDAEAVDAAGIAKVWADEAPTNANNSQSGTKTTALADPGGSVTLSELLKNNQGQPPTVETKRPAGFNFSARPAEVSPVAWAAVLLSFVFILFMIVRALLMQNELRRPEPPGEAAA